MKTTFRRSTAAGVMGSFGGYMGWGLAILIAACAWGDTVYLVRSDGSVIPVDTANPGPHAKTAGMSVPMKAAGIAFTVSYADVRLHNGFGFDDPVNGAARQAVVNEILNYMNSVLSESGECDILFEESMNKGPSGTGMLAATGTFFANVSGFSNGYAFDHITTGVAPSPDVPDIDGTVDFGWTWFQGTGTPSKKEIDLRSVLLHELTHGLGILSLSNSSGNSDQAPNIYAVWDRLLTNGSGQSLFGGSPPRFLGTRNDLVGLAGGILFNGANARAAYGSSPPVYAPNPFQTGSSVSHWDRAVPAVMVPAIGGGTVLRQYAAVDIAALQDIGYRTTSPQLPSAAFTADVVSGLAPLTVHFTDQSTPGSTPITSWLWSFGDASTGTDPNPTHVYVNVGTYSVSLTVTASGGSNTASKPAYIHASTQFTLTPGAGLGGTISPNTPVAVSPGGSQTFTIAPNPNYSVGDVRVDGVSAGPLAAFTFSNVTASHTIQASFILNPPAFTLTPTAGPGGAILPNAPVKVAANSDRVFTIRPDTNYHVADVLVDGVSVGAATNYTFSHVTASHTISATFATTPQPAGCFGQI